MLRAVLETNPDALDIAASLDAERRAGKTRGPMHGIPVLVNDNIDTADRMHTTAGSEALADAPATRDAFIVERLRAAGAIVSEGYRKALATCRELSRAKGLDAAFARHRVDAIVAPTQGAPSLIDLVNGDPGGSSSTSPCAVAGYPAITVPMGYTRGLPLGITFMGRAWSEATLLRLAYAFEQASKVRKAPKFAASADLA